ncbi:hypothetical protein [Fibrella aquatica]|uniref:hypothetical protein n=1 Tax=Fibrella aquatica TaxID=3242487 RepID=UPI0035219DBD
MQKLMTFNDLPGAVTNLTREIGELKATVKKLAERSSTMSEPYGTFKWLCLVAPIPIGTLRIRSSRGEIPGTKKIGKRLLYNKETVLEWLESQDLPERAVRSSRSSKRNLKS